MFKISKVVRYFLLLFSLISLLSLLACNEKQGGFQLKAAQIKWNNAATQFTEQELRVLESGERLYVVNCSGCHLRNGAGQMQYIGAPALSNNSLLKGEPSQHIRIILMGKKAMPAYRTSLSNEVIAAIVSYEKNAWGNNSGFIVSTEQVNAVKIKATGIKKNN